MEIRRGHYRSLGSCNFCDRAKLTAGGYDLVYPYKQVYHILGKGIGVRICDHCLDELNKEVDFLRAKEIADKLTEGEDIV